MILNLNDMISDIRYLFISIIQFSFHNILWVDTYSRFNYFKEINYFIVDRWRIVDKIELCDLSKIKNT